MYISSCEPLSNVSLVSNLSITQCVCMLYTHRDESMGRFADTTLLSNEY